jgi:hypothetical protein
LSLIKILEIDDLFSSHSAIASGNQFVRVQISQLVIQGNILNAIPFRIVNLRKKTQNKKIKEEKKKKDT